MKCFTHFNILMMYFSLLNRLIATVTVCSLLLQGCRSSFQINSKDFVLKEASKTDDDAQSTTQASAPDGQSSVLSDVPNGEPPIVASATLPPVAASTDQVTSLMRHLAVGLDTVSIREQAPSTESELSCLVSSRALPLLVSTPAFGAQEWARYFGEVGVAPPLPSDTDKILDGPCPFWRGKRVKDTHLLVLIPSTVNGKAFTLDLLGELIQHPRGGGHCAWYLLYEDEVQQLSGDVYSSSSYWVLLTRDVLPGSRNEPYGAQQALVAAQTAHINHAPYAIPNVLEAATAILAHYVRNGDRLYEEGGDALPSTSTRCTALPEAASGHPSPVTVGRFCDRGLVFLSGFDGYVELGTSFLRRFGSRHYRPSALLHPFGAEDWRRYFGEVEEAPPLPARIVDMLNGACPFWPEKPIKDTHLLVLIPATVNGEPFSLNLLGDLVERPQGGGHSAKYRYYDRDVREQLGAQSPGYSYWVLMTRDVLEGSREETHASQKVLVAHHASRTGLSYELPGVLEATTAILSHYVRSGESLYAGPPLTYTRCQELVVYGGDDYPILVGGFSSGGLRVSSYGNVVHSCSGVAGLRKF